MTLAVRSDALNPSPKHEPFPGSIPELEEGIARRKMQVAILLAELKAPAAAELEAEVRAWEKQLEAMKADDVKADAEDRPLIARGAGVLIRSKDGRALFIKRAANAQDFPGYWCFPGGGIEDGETAIDAARRETIEEVGSIPKGELVPLARSVSTYELPPKGAAANGAAEAGALPPATAPGALKTVDYENFLLEIDAPFDVALNAESSGFAWTPLSDPPLPLHPGAAIAIKRLFADELGVARMLADGELASPQRYRNVTLWPMRITGTGVAYRMPRFKKDAKGEVVLGEDKKPIVEEEEEFPWRDPGLYLNDEFLARCNGLPVIAGHPKGKTLDSKEFERRIVGTIFLPYVKGDEVWGIAKVWDDETNAELAKGDYSTSPAVVLSDPNNPSYKFRLEDGSILLVEGKPSLLDHLAICQRGVWDKGGEPAGIKNDSQGEDLTPLLRAIAWAGVEMKVSALKNFHPTNTPA